MSCLNKCIICFYCAKLPTMVDKLKIKVIISMIRKLELFSTFFTSSGLWVWSKQKPHILTFFFYLYSYDKLDQVNGALLDPLTTLFIGTQTGDANFNCSRKEKEWKHFYSYDTKHWTIWTLGNKVVAEVGVKLLTSSSLRINFKSRVEFKIRAVYN